MDMLLKIVQSPTTTAPQKVCLQYSLAPTCLHNIVISRNFQDGALHMIGTMADILLKKKTYKDKLEQFLVNIVFPEFQSPHGHLRARACWMLHYFAGMKKRSFFSTRWCGFFREINFTKNLVHTTYV